MIITAFFCILGALVVWWLVGALSFYAGCKLDTDLSSIRQGYRLGEMLTISSFGPILGMMVVATMVYPRVKAWLAEWFAGLPIWSLAAKFKDIYVIPPREVTERDIELNKKYPPYQG